MDITCYLPDDFGKLAKAGLNFSQILRAGVAEVLGVEAPRDGRLRDGSSKVTSTSARLAKLERIGEKDWDALCRLAERVSKAETRLQALEENVTPTDVVEEHHCFCLCPECATECAE